MRTHELFSFIIRHRVKWTLGRDENPGVPRQWRGFFASQQVERIYLNELGASADQSLGLGIVQLVVSRKRNVPQQAQRLIQQARAIGDVTLQRQIIDLIETIVFYKFPDKSRKEIEAMFGLSELKQTKIYQEAKEEGKLEGKLEAVSRLLKLHLTVEQIAEALGLEVEQVRQVVETQAED